MATKKIRVARKATKGNKKKGWRKGFSSSSNPETHRFRDQAKASVFSTERAGVGNLTEAALAYHNNLENQKLNTSSATSDIAEDSESIGGKTFDTFASNWSNCSNVSFNRLFRTWNASSALHKEMLAVIAAVTEVIKSKGGKETETEYFAVLMTTLETVETVEAASAVVSLLGMVIKRLPPSVLKAKFSETSKVLINLLHVHMESEHTVLLRAVLGCLSTLFRAQESILWENSSTTKMYEMLLSFIIHPKPKVRKAAHHAVCAILRGSAIMLTSDPPPYHPAAIVTTKFCIRKIEECGALTTATTTLHILMLLKAILPCFPQAQMKSTCETILRLMTLGNTIITSQSLQVFYGMFSSQPNKENLPTELCAQTIMALYDYQPNLHDTQPLIIWLTVMKAGIEHLYTLDEKLCISHLPKLFGVVVPCWLSEKKEVMVVVTGILNSILISCVLPSAPLFGKMIQNAEFGVLTPVHKIIQSLENALRYQYHAAWGEVLQVLAVMFEVLGRECHSLMTKCIQSLSDLRESPHFSYTGELDRALGAAIRSMGPDIVLQMIPIQFSKFENASDFPRSWLLPIIRDNVQQTKLSFFVKHFLPVALDLKKQIDKMEKEGRMIEAKTFDVLQQQIWSMLPGFCTEPVDLIDSFKTIAKTLGVALNDRPDIRTHILSALRVLINKNKDNDANRAELSRFSKNYLPILFNLFTAPPSEKHDEGVRLAVFETIKVYLQITDRELCNTFMQKAIEKLQSQDIQLQERHALMDLTTILLPFVSKEHVKCLYEYCKPLLNNHERTSQKKAYRIIEELCKGSSDNCKTFVQSNLPEFQELLLTTLSLSSPPSKGPRLRALCHIVHQLTEVHRNFVISVVPEAVLCTKETAEKPRIAAFNLLVEVGQAFLRWNEDKQAAIKEYTQMLIGGLAGSTHLASASILALCKVMHEFKDLMPFQLVHEIINDVLTLLHSKHREVVQSGIFFIKHLFAVLKTVDLELHVENIVQNLCSIPAEQYRHFRFNAKEIFIKLVRKFGCERIAKFVPDTHQKILRNIRKVESRKARLHKIKKEKQQVDSDYLAPSKIQADGIDEVLEELDEELMQDIEEDNLSDKNDKKHKKLTEASAWIEEQGDEIVDFLDPKVCQKVRATNPFEAKGSKKESDFKMTKDGKIIIEEEEEDRAKSERGGTKKTHRLEEQFSGIEISPHKRRAEDDSDVEDADIKQYKAGGSGIHRPVKKKQKMVHSDAKKEGKLEPYSYIPLDRKALNRRKRTKLAGQFKGIVKAAKRGAQKGVKSKIRADRKH